MYTSAHTIVASSSLCIYWVSRIPSSLFEGTLPMPARDLLFLFVLHAVLKMFKVSHAVKKITLEIATCIVVSCLLRDNRKYCGITSRWVYIPPPYKILFLNSRPCQNKVWIVGIVDPRTIVCERPDPSTTPHPKRVSVLFLAVMQKTTVHHIYILAPIHSSQTPHLPSFFTLPSTSTITPFLKQ